ncbi:hypothetical protein AMTRI_Chr04g187270 [Amborella trichopoda]
MGKNYNFDFCGQSPRPLPFMNLSSIPSYGLNPSIEPTTQEYFPSASSPVPDFAVSASPELKLIDSSGPSSWYYYCQNGSNPFTTFTSNPVEEGTVSLFPHESRCLDQKPEASSSNLGAPSRRRSFIVFDQCGSRRSLFFGSIPSQSQLPDSTSPKGFDSSYFRWGPSNGLPNQNLPAIVERAKAAQGDESKEMSSAGQVSEMHEDTEEIEALMSSDDEEETSTGHSPLDMREFEKDKDHYEEYEEEEEEGEEVDSYVSIKRRKIDKMCGGGALGAPHHVSLMDSASSVKGHEKWGSNTGFNSTMGPQFHGKTGTTSGSRCEEEARTKRSRRDKIKKTVGILRKIIPGGKGKDAAVVLDDAIRYLRSLRLKVKVADAAS